MDLLNTDVFITTLMQIVSTCIRALPLILLLIYVMRQKSERQLFKAIRVYVIVQFAAMIIWTAVQVWNQIRMITGDNYVIEFDGIEVVYLFVGGVTSAAHVVVLIMLLSAFWKEKGTEAEHV